MKPSEIREMNMDEIKLKIKDVSKELFNIKFKHVTGRLDNPMNIPMLRKDIARMKTIIKEKGLGKRA